MKYFTFEEFTRSETASKKKIDNILPEEYKERFEEFCDKILDPLREAWGTPIKITSGYRCDALNKAVGGSPTSSHKEGYAVDLQPIGRDIEKFAFFVKEFLYSRDFDQCIDEYNGSTHWIHIGFRNNKNEQRKKFLVYKKGKYTTWK